MSTDDPRSPDETTDWPGTSPEPPVQADDAERTVVFGKTPSPGQGDDQTQIVRPSQPRQDVGPQTSPAPPPPPLGVQPPRAPAPPPPAAGQHQPAPPAQQPTSAGPAAPPPPPPGAVNPTGAGQPYPTGGGWSPGHGGPGGPPPQGYWPAQQQQPSKSNTPMLLIGGAVAAIVILAVALIAVISRGGESTETASPTTPPTTEPADEDDQSGTGGGETSATTTPPTATTTARQSGAGGTIDPSGLDRYLLSASETGRKFSLDKPMMEASVVETKMISGSIVTPSKCASAYGPALASTYNGTGYTGMAANVVNEIPQPNRQVLQAVVAFPDKAAAKAFFDEQVEAWTDCKYKELTSSGGGESSSVKVGITTIMEGVAGVLLFPDVAPGAPNKTCQRGLGTKHNVIIDVRACGTGTGASNVANTGWTIARDITEKID